MNTKPRFTLLDAPMAHMHTDGWSPQSSTCQDSGIFPVFGSKRIFDVLLALPLLLLTLPLLIFLAILTRATSRGPALYWSNRVGRNNRIFRMPKFRSMSIDAPPLPTHLLANPKSYLTPTGSFLRRMSLDELPQLFSILKGDLSFVGPRPALFNQDDLVALRTECGVHRLVPGLTGWAQVNGRDELPIPVKVQFDYEYLLRRSLKFDIRIICMTVVKVIRGEGIRH
jgi:O-antigen biosynthesis protein WbqP